MFFLLLIYDEIQIALVRKDGVICEGNFIYTKLSKPPELISFLFGDENPIINNLLGVKKLLQQSSIFLERKPWDFRLLNL